MTSRGAGVQCRLGRWPIYRIRQTIGAMAATLGGVDALVFTAGVGEHAAVIRARVCENLSYLGLTLDHTANDACQPDADSRVGLDRPYPGHRRA